MINFDKGLVDIKIDLFYIELEHIIISYMSNFHETKKENVTLTWDKNDNSFVSPEKELDYGCEIKIEKDKVSNTGYKFNETIMLKKDNKAMEKNIVYMIIESLALDDHEYAINLIGYEVVNENDKIKFNLHFSMN